MSGSWLIRRHDPGEHDEPTVAEGLSEAEARRRASELNQRLNAVEGVPIRSPFRFYFAGNLNDKDAGIYTRAIANATASDSDRNREEDDVIDGMITFPGDNHAPVHPDAIGEVGDLPRQYFSAPADAPSDPAPTPRPRPCAWCTAPFMSLNPARLKCDRCVKLKEHPAARLKRAERKASQTPAAKPTPRPEPKPARPRPEPKPAPTEDPASKTEPAHYRDLTPEPIDVIERWKLDFCLGNALKYLARAGRKGGESELDDLKKAAWYLQRRIAQLEHQS